jgi:mono/diheme cytochrome c family protein
MAEVVAASLQHLHDDDIHAISTYIKSLPQQLAPQAAPPERMREEEKKAMLALGQKLYKDQCASCHRMSGQGAAPAYPALAGNDAITMAATPTNAIRMVLNGGYPPSTGGNPRPYGMPPFGPSMNDEEVAAVLSYIRNAWGNQGSVVSPNEVNQYRSRQGQ